MERYDMVMSDGENATRVLIAGASIAGPALAYWLNRFGADVTVLERAPSPRRGGQAVDAHGVAREVLRRMGLDERVRDRRIRTRGMRIVDADGSILSTDQADDGGDGPDAEIEILRGDLSDVLRGAAGEQVTFRYGDHITEVSQDADGVNVTSAAGDRARYDLVVGADGLHSGLRELVFGPREDYVRHLGHVAAYYRVPDEFGLDGWQIVHAEPDRHAGLLPIAREGDVAVATLGVHAPDQRVDHRDVPAQKRLLRERMAGMGWCVSRLLAHLDTTGDFYLDQVARVVMPAWSSGRIALLGDAAFCPSPMSGQGTGLALVGAYVLAGELAAAGWDPTVGFAGYERLMRPFVETDPSIVGPGSADEADAGLSRDASDVDVMAAAANGIELPQYPVSRS